MEPAGFRRFERGSKPVGFGGFGVDGDRGLAEAFEKSHHPLNLRKDHGPPQVELAGFRRFGRGSRPVGFGGFGVDGVP